MLHLTKQEEEAAMQTQICEARTEHTKVYPREASTCAMKVKADTVTNTCCFNKRRSIALAKKA